MTEAISGRDKLLRFLNDWRDRLLRTPSLSDREFGQLIALNTVIAFIQEDV